MNEMDERDALMLSLNFGKGLQLYDLRKVKQVIISKFMDLAAEDVPPDFDKHKPDDLMIVFQYRNGTCEVIPAGEQFTIAY